MAVIDVNELSDECTGPTRSDDGNVDYTRTFEVRTNTIMTGDDVVLDSRLPRLFFPHPSRIAALIVGIEPQIETDDNFYWRVKCRYSTKIPRLSQPDIGQGGTNPDGKGDPANTNPLLRTPKYKFTCRRYEESEYRDINGNLMVNAANEALEPVTESRPRLTLSVKRNLAPAAFNPLAIEEFVGATNSVPYLGWNDHEVYLDDMDCEPMWEQGVAFWEVNAVLLFSRIEHVGTSTDPTQQEKGGWYTRRLNAGFNQIITRNGIAQAGGSTTITLDAGASATDGAYKGYGIRITAGTGVNQTNVITAYVGSTKVATVQTAWTTTPDSTSNFTTTSPPTPIMLNGQKPSKPYPLDPVGNQLAVGALPNYLRFRTKRERDFNLLGLF